jgi:RNA polymerase sigma-70 factor (ECF subfamily)
VPQQPQKKARAARLSTVAEPARKQVFSRNLADWGRFRDGLQLCEHPTPMMLALACPSDLQGSHWAGQVPRAMAAEPDVVEIYEQHFDFAWRSLRRLGVLPDDLEDAVQDVFFVVHRRLSDFEYRSTIKSWIFGIAIRVAKIYRNQAARRRRQVAAEAAVLVCSRDNPEQARGHLQAAEQVQQLLDQLDDDQRAVFILAELEQLSAPEMAAALGIPQNTVYSRLRLARAAFEAGLRRMQAKDDWRHR